MSRKSHIRGALTTGTKWHFIVVDLNADDDDATYWVSQPVEWRYKRVPAARELVIEETSDESDPVLIVGILSSWVSLTAQFLPFWMKEADVRCC